MLSRLPNSTTSKYEGILVSLTELCRDGPTRTSVKFKPGLPDSRAEVTVGNKLLLLWFREAAALEEFRTPRADGLVLQQLDKSSSYRQVATRRVSACLSHDQGAGWRMGTLFV